MRQRFAIAFTAAGQRWPEIQGGVNLEEFNWVKVDNRGAGAVSLGPAFTPGQNDPVDYYAQIPAGQVRVFNVGPPRDRVKDSSDTWWQELHVIALGAATVQLEVADYPIVDLPSSLGLSGAAPPVTVSGIVSAEGLTWQLAESATPLTAGSTFNGSIRDTGSTVVAGAGWARFRAFVNADQAGTLNLRQSRDGTTFYTTVSVPVAANSPTILESLVTLRYVRIQYVNGATNQGSFEADSTLIST